MPTYSRKKASARRRRIERRPDGKRRKPTSYMPLPLVIGGFPKTKVVKLRYVDEVSLDASAVALARHSFSANGLYDPDSTGTGHQPMNFDTWMNLYDHYTVLGSKIDVRLVKTDSLNIDPAYFGILMSDTGARSAGMAVPELLEQRNYKPSRHRATGAVYSSPNGALQCTATYSPKKWFGLSKTAVRAQDKLIGTGSTNPSDQIYYEIVNASIGGNNPGAQNYLVKIDYIVLLTEPKPGVYS